MLNHIVMQGRLCNDPEIRYTQSNTPVANFRIACERDFADGSGKRATDFVNVVAWRGTGEFVKKYFQKGSMILVSGRLQMREWTDREGDKHTAAEIVAEIVHFGESKRREDGRPVDVSAGGFEDLEDEDGELPF